MHFMHSLGEIKFQVSENFFRIVMLEHFLLWWRSSWIADRHGNPTSNRSSLIYCLYVCQLFWRVIIWCCKNLNSLTGDIRNISDV